MKRSQGKDAPSGDPPIGNFLSWNRAGQPRCLRVELADGTFYVFPYQHLAYVKFEPGTDETINVTVSSHEVKITGKNLGELALAFQKFTVDWVKELPGRGRFVAAANGEGVHIASIAVTKTQASQRPGLPLMIRGANLSFLTCNLCPPVLISAALYVRVGERG